MKTIITNLLLLFSIAVFSQDAATINALVQSNNLAEIKSVSDRITATASEKFVYYKTTDRTLRDEKFKVVVYTPANMTDEEKQEFTPDEKAKCLVVVWKDNGGSYTFSEVSNQEKNLLPFWNSTFTASDNQYRVSKDLKYKYVKNENSVSILKSY